MFFLFKHIILYIMILIYNNQNEYYDNNVSIFQISKISFLSLKITTQHQKNKKIPFDFFFFSLQK